MKFIIWMILGILFFIIEILTPGIFFFTSLSIGFFMAGFSTFLFTNIYLQWTVFLIFSILSILIIKFIMRKNGGKPVRLANVDGLKGRTAVVIMSIQPSLNQGLVKVDGEEWRAVAEEEVKKGEQVRIQEIEGNHLIVKKIS
ncbi:MAG: NfeD family protein [bacterium]|nr:NfeD family protein [bacterium]